MRDGPRPGSPWQRLAVVAVSGKLCGWIWPGRRLACDVLLRGARSTAARAAWLSLLVALLNHSWMVPHTWRAPTIDGAEGGGDVGCPPPPWRLQDAQTSFSRSRPLDFPVRMGEGFSSRRGICNFRVVPDAMSLLFDPQDVPLWGTRGSSGFQKDQPRNGSLGILCGLFWMARKTVSPGLSTTMLHLRWDVPSRVVNKQP